MAKFIIRYLLDGDGSIPKFVENGGYFPLAEELVGVSIDTSKRHMPGSVIKLTKEDLIDRIQLSHRDEDGELISAEEAEDITEAFLAINGLEDYE